MCFSFFFVVVLQHQSSLQLIFLWLIEALLDSYWSGITQKILSSLIDVFFFNKKNVSYCCFCFEDIFLFLTNDELVYTFNYSKKLSKYKLCKNLFHTGQACIIANIQMYCKFPKHNFLYFFFQFFKLYDN